MEKRNFFNYLYPLLGVSLLLLAGCRGGAPVSTEPHPYVTAHTAERVTVNSDIIVEFAENTPFITAPEIGAAVGEVLKFSPKVKGKAVWGDNQTLIFTPDAPLKLEKSYLVTVMMDKLVDETEGVEDNYTFQITTRSPFFDITTNGLEVYPDKEDVFKFSGTVTTEEPMDEASVQKILKMNGGGKLKAHWTHSDDGRTHHFVVDDIAAKDKDYQVVAQFDGEYVGANAKRKEVLQVPRKGLFTITDLRVQYEPEFRVVATFSAAIDSKQRFADFITYVPGNFSPRYVASSNKLYIYPDKRTALEYRMKVAPGLVSIGGYKMEKEYEGKFSLKEQHPTVKFLNSGSILPSSNNMSIPFQAINYGKVKVKVTRIYQNNIMQFFQVNGWTGDDQIYRVGKEIISTEILLAKEGSPKLKEWGNYSLDLNKLIKAESGAIYRLEIRGVDPLAELDGDEWYYEYYGGPWETRHERQRNIFASDIGVIAKYGNQGMMSIYTTNLINVQPLSGAEVKVYNYVNQEIAKGSTDGNGFTELKIAETPSMVVVRSGQQFGYLEVKKGKALSLSTFDVDGRAVEQGLKCLMYGDRGVWRPGDNIYLSTMVMDRDGQLPKNHPVSIRFVNPNGQEVSSQTKALGKNGLNSFVLKTGQEDITGYYTVEMTVGNVKTTKRLRIETIKPNRLKIDFSLDGEPNVSADNMQGHIFSEWLHGATASNLNTRVDMVLAQTTTSFDGYKGFQFEDISKFFYGSEERKVFEGKLGINGKVDFTQKAEINRSNIPSMLSAKFTVRVFEESGDFSIDQHSVRLSPYSRYVGVKVPETKNWRGSLDNEIDYRFNVATLTPQGKPVAVQGLEVKIKRYEWFWWWDSAEHRTARYMNDYLRETVYSTTISTNNKGEGVFNYKWDGSDWGIYSVEVTDPTGHSSSQLVYVGSGYYDEGNEEGGAVLLKLQSDKTTYRAGETAQITMESSEGARALVTIESGSKVLQSLWYDLKANSTTIPITITKDMTPNIYVSVMMIQPHINTLNDAPMRLYGILPLMVEDEATRLTPVITVPKEVMPEREFTISVGEKSRHAMSYTIAVVDEGLLGLTRFQTPDPWKAFFAKEALGVSTWDLYNNVIGAYGGVIDQMFAIGGDGEADEDTGNMKAQRFKPVVKFMGPFELKKGETAKHSVKLDPYIGAVRVMVVACADNAAYGKAEAKIHVRKPLMVQVTMPRVIGVDETVSVPVTVFSTEEGAQNVKVSIKKSEGFSLSGSSTQNVQLNGVEDKLVYFTLKASDLEGVGRVTVVVESSKDSSQESIELDIRNPNPRSVNSITHSMKAGETYNGDFELVGKKGTNTLALEISGVVPLNLSQRLDYLLRYPHGCLEQTTSTIFPQLFLARALPLDKKISSRSETNIKAALDKYKRFQLNSGVFSYWPGERYVNRWTSCYAGHFMTEARKEGYSIAGSLWDKWLEAETRIASEWSSNSSGSAGSIEIQAYRLYVIALAGKADMSAMNRLRDNKNMNAVDRALLAGAYGLAGRKDIGNDLLKGVKFDNWREDYDNGHSFGSSTRDRALVVVMNLHLGNRTEIMPIVQQLSKDLNSNKWMSTQSTAWALMAVAQFNSSMTDTELNFEYSVAGSKGKEKLKASVKEVEFDVKRSEGKVPVSVTNKSNKEIFLTLTSYGVPSQGAEVERSDNIRISATYTDLDGNTVDVTKLKQGDDFYVNLSVINPGNLGHYENIVLSQVFPSGWEILGSSASKGKLRYQDIRDDRVYSYFDMGSSTEIVVRTKLSATYAGRFYLPSIVCEAMYDGRIFASTLGRWCEVTK